MTALADRIQRGTPFLWLGMRTGLAIVLAVGIALAMDWQRPQWAGIAVMSISQDRGAATRGKGVLRLLATLGAAVSALTLIALFYQDRWGFFLALSLYVGLCGYHMLGSRHAYAWRVATYVCPVIAISAGGADGINDFATAIERLLENVTGVLAIVSLGLLVRPPGGRTSLEDHVSSLVRTFADLLDPSMPELAGRKSPDQGSADAVWNLRHGLLQYEMKLEAAIDEHFRIRQQRKTWRLLRSQLTELLEQIECWRLSLCQPGPKGAPWFMERQRAAAHTVRQRLQRLAPANPPAPEPPESSFSSAKLIGESGHLGDLPARERAALILASRQWRRIEKTTMAVEDLLGRLQRDPRDVPVIQEESESAWALNPDHLHVGVRLMLGIWVAALLWMFVPDLPGGAGIVTLTAVFSVVFALAKMPAMKVLPIVLLSLLPAGLLYVFVLPHLEGYSQLAILLFVYTVTAFLIAGNKTPSRTLAVNFLLITFGITNQQTYDLIGFIDRTLAIILSCGIIALLQEMLWPSRSPQNYLQSLSDLQRSVVAMIDWLCVPQGRYPLRRLLRQHRLTFLKQELWRLPDKLEGLSRSLTPATTGCSAEAISRINEAARSVALWALELERACTGPAAANPAVEAAGGIGEGEGRRPVEPLGNAWNDLRERMIRLECSALHHLGESSSRPASVRGEQALHVLAAVARGLAESADHLQPARLFENGQETSGSLKSSLP